MSGFNISLKGDKEFRQFLRRGGERSRDLRVPLKIGGVHMLASIAENFDRQGRPDKWADLAPKTWEKKLKRGHNKILIETADLKNSISFQALGRELRVGTNKVYGRIQQLGREAGKKRGPKVGRPFLLFQKEDVNFIKDTVAKHILQK